MGYTVPENEVVTPAGSKTNTFVACPSGVPLSGGDASGALVTDVTLAATSPSSKDWEVSENDGSGSDNTILV